MPLPRSAPYFWMASTAYCEHVGWNRHPPGASECESQPDQGSGEGCSGSDLAYWFKDSVLHPKPPKVPPKPKPPMTMSALPAACKAILNAPDAKQ